MGEAFLESTMGPYTVRRFCSDDAAGVTRLVEGVYGDTYYPRQLYNPDEIVHSTRRKAGTQSSLSIRRVK